MPVLPLVGSTMIERPGVIRRSRSAASIIESAMRSFTDPPGLYCSHLTHTSAAPAGTTACSRTSGVRPMRSSSELACSSGGGGTMAGTLTAFLAGGGWEAD